jgi:Sec-independent protein translocase protein TatA
MYGLQPTHILLIIIVALIFFMPSRLPQIARGFRDMISSFKEETKQLDEPKKTAEEK